MITDISTLNRLGRWLCVMSIGVFGWCQGSHAAVWDGGGADENFSTPANWDTGSVPGAGDVAVFTSTSSKP